MSLPQLDPALLERHAAQLERKAAGVRRGSILVGALLGLALGAVPVSPLGTYLPVPAAFAVATLLAGGALGALLGRVVGDGRAFRIRVQAQLVLHALHGGQAAQAPPFEQAELLPIRRAVLESVPAQSEPRLEALPQLPPLSPTAGV